MSGNHNETKYHNLEFLTGILELKQLKANSTVFEKDDIFVLSPAVGKGSNLFDIREVNIEMFDKKNYRAGLVILRIVEGDKFLIVELNELSGLIGEYFANSKKGGITWKFRINSLKNFYDSEFDNSTFVYIYNHNNNSVSPVRTVLLNKDDVICIFEDYLSVNV